MRDINHINITLDLFSAVITVMICAYLINQGDESGGKRNFLWICILNLVFILGDLSDWCCNGLAKPWYPVLLRVGQFVYYTVMIPMLVLLMRYVMGYVSDSVRTQNVSVNQSAIYSIYMRIALVVAVLHLIGAVASPFTGLYYSITPENIYLRGEWVVLASIFPIVVYVFIFLTVIRFRKLLRPRAIVALLSFALFPLLGQGIQSLFRGVATLNPAITLALLLIFFNIQMDKDIQYEKDKRELVQANIRIMLSQIQPHFLYNTLSTLRSLCETDPARAKKCIDDFAVFLRANMDSLTNERPIFFGQELRHVKSYLNLEQQMYGDELCVEYDIKTTNFMVPALSLQPIVENAVQKGLRKKEGGGTVTIRTEEHEREFRIVVMDDGVGFDINLLGESGHIGIKNVEKRLRAMCGGQMDIESVPGNGTTVLMTIPKGGEADAVSCS